MASSLKRRTPWGIVLAALLVGLPPSGAEESKPFDPNTEVSTAHTTVDTVSNITFRVTQNDREELIRDYRVELPAGWRFSVGTIDPGSVQSCADATFANAIDHMEVVGMATLRLHTSDFESQPGTRNTNPSVHPEGPLFAETQEPGPAVYNNGAISPGGIFFLRWDADTSAATMCGYVRTSNKRIQANRREIVFQLTMTLLSDNSWNLGFTFDAVPGVSPNSPRSITDDQWYLDRDVSILEAALMFRGLTAGNHQTDAAGNQCERPQDGRGTNTYSPCSVAFIQTPTEAGEYLIRSQLSPCRAGSSGCSRPPVVGEFLIRVTPPGSEFIHHWGKLTGPSTRGLPPGFAFVSAASEVNVTWEQPFMHPAERPRGYVLVIAPPGDQGNRHFEYLVTDPTAEGFDARLPCGGDGTEPVCSLTLRFPIAIRGGLLPPDGRYDLALVTFYEDGHRTDGKCDDGPGNPEGKTCNLHLSGFRIAQDPRVRFGNAPLGISTWQILLRSDHWPLAFAESQRVALSGTSNSFDAPMFVLLVDFTSKAGEFIVWNPLSGGEDVYPARSTTIVGSDIDRTGVVSFASASMMGHARQFRFDGVVVPAEGCGSLISGACGMFVLYDLKGLPGAIPPGGMPTGSLEPFEGRVIG